MKIFKTHGQRLWRYHVLISLPVVMLVVGLLCYTILEMFGFNAYAFRLSCGFAVIGGGFFAYNWNNFLNPKDNNK